ncbi:uncharacterized protein LOC141499209 [Macrotis lagotis]|uniref:uncharacterized protein LOC141499209 n=1 Tax=Macrotis lagotis TaxID=92651 RepID=UPI003D693075
MTNCVPSLNCPVKHPLSPPTSVRTKPLPPPAQAAIKATSLPLGAAALPARRGRPEPPVSRPAGRGRPPPVGAQGQGGGPRERPAALPRRGGGRWAGPGLPSASPLGRRRLQLRGVPFRVWTLEAVPAAAAAAAAPRALALHRPRQEVQYSRAYFKEKNFHLYLAAIHLFIADSCLLLSTKTGEERLPHPSGRRKESAEQI